MYFVKILTSKDSSVFALVLAFESRDSLRSLGMSAMLPLALAFELAFEFEFVFATLSQYVYIIWPKHQSFPSG